MCLYLAHCLSVVDLLPAVRTLVVLQVRNRVFLSLEVASPVPPNPLDALAATRRTRRDVKLRHSFNAISSMIPEKRNSFLGSFLNEPIFRV